MVYQFKGGPNLDFKNKSFESELYKLRIYPFTPFLLWNLVKREMLTSVHRVLFKQSKEVIYT